MNGFTNHNNVMDEMSESEYRIALIVEFCFWVFLLLLCIGFILTGEMTLPEMTGPFGVIFILAMLNGIHVMNYKSKYVGYEKKNIGHWKEIR